MASATPDGLECIYESGEPSLSPKEALRQPVYIKIT